jgi:hypothetical protein
MQSLYSDRHYPLPIYKIDTPQAPTVGMYNTGLMTRRNDRGFLIVILHTQINTFSNGKMKRFLTTPEYEPNASSSAFIQVPLGSYQTPSPSPVIGKEGARSPERPTSETQATFGYSLVIKNFLQ